VVMQNILKMIKLFVFKIVQLKIQVYLNEYLILLTINN